MDFIVTDLHKTTERELFNAAIEQEEELCLSFPLSSIGFTQSYIDIIHDYATVSFCSEKIAPFIHVSDSSLTTRDKYYTDFKIKCKVTDARNLKESIFYFSEMLTEELKEYDDSDVLSFYDEVSEYEESFNKRVFNFPELIDGYWANMINGAYKEIALEYYESENKFLKKIYRKHPEHRYGFWKNASSVHFKNVVYFSTEGWIIPPYSNTDEALKIYSGVSNLQLEEAEQVDYNGKCVLINNSTAVFFEQYDQLFNSLLCVKSVFQKKKSANSVNPDNIQKDLFGAPVINKLAKKRKNQDISITLDTSKIKYKLSEFGDIITLEYEEYTYVFFSHKSLTFEEIKELNNFLYPVYAKTQHLIDISISEKCDWGELDDDTFEELCYDILFCHPYFDSSTIRKMGKSKSRDGGRDITIKSKRTPTQEPVLYVFQCKFLSGKTSLSASKVSNAGNVIMQYGAKGYGIFTTTVIDATLHDMLDGFSCNIGTETSSFRWSKYELERYLNRYQIIKNKYFKK